MSAIATFKRGFPTMCCSLFLMNSCNSSGFFFFHPCQQYLKKLHMQERAIEEVKLAIKPFYQNRDINKDEYKEILRKAVQKVGSRRGSRPLLFSNGFRSSTWSSPSPGVPQQERRDQPGEGGQPGQGLRGQIQTRQETQERRRLRKDAGRSVRGHRTR